MALLKNKQMTSLKSPNFTNNVHKASHYTAEGEAVFSVISAS